MSSEGPRTESFDSQEDPRGPSLRAGDLVLERYRVERPIGRGGMGEVYEATHVTLGSRVALKLPLAKRVSNRGAARLLREARVAASLDPERVVRVLDVGVLGDGRPVIVLERLEGETLAERIARPPKLSVVEAVDFTIEACLGLADAHAAGIVHRDVKPSNLFIAQRRDGSAILKVLDFGVAGFRAAKDDEGSRLTDSHTPVGSPPYMAPEQIRAREVDARADVWGLGVTLFEMLAQRLPFEGPSTAAISAAIVADEPENLRTLRSDLPDGLSELVHRCLSKQVSDRPMDARSLARELAPYASPAQRNSVGVAHARSQDRSSLTSLVSAGALSRTRSLSTSSSTQPLRSKAPWLAVGAATLGLIAWLIFFRQDSSAHQEKSAQQATPSAEAEEPSSVATATAPVLAPSPVPSLTALAASATMPSSDVAAPAFSSAAVAAEGSSARGDRHPNPPPSNKPVVNRSASPAPAGAASASATAGPASTHIMDQRKF